MLMMDGERTFYVQKFINHLTKLKK
jgi:hypothetical protein